jgi:4-diphosphocytidyl-2-C-methyl-D-erythritol kinase
MLVASRRSRMIAAMNDDATGGTGEAAGVRVRRRAHAKVNLALAVGRPIEEGEHAGMHPIASWMAPIDLADDLEVTRLEDDRFSRYAVLWAGDAPQPAAEIDWSITDDLAVRAHLLMERETGRKLPVQMKLEKRVPVGAGLGGGSSDAAAMLLAVNELFGLGFGENKLVKLAAELGSDVPFFLRAAADAGGHAIVEGLGDELTTVGASAGHMVLLLPEFGCATGRVYHTYDERFDDADEGSAEAARDEASFRERVASVRELAAEGASRGLVHEGLFNDLASAAERVEPRVAEVRAQAARALGVEPHVTGSGAAMFVVCRGGRVEAELLAEQIVRAVEDCAAVPARLV